MYCSLDKIDLAAEVEGRPVAVQADHRSRAELEAEPALSALFAMTRVLNARSLLGEATHPIIRYAVVADPPPLLHAALVAAGATLERAGAAIALGEPSDDAISELADHCFRELARHAAARVGSRDLAIALRMLEDQTCAAPPARDDEPAYWSRVIELAALAGELLRARYPGRWVRSDRAVVPFGFKLDADATVMFPTNRAQRVIDDGDGESLFKLLVAADETLHRPSDPATGRLMPSLRERADVELDEVLWRPLLAEHGPAELPIIVCGLDGESTFGMIRREAFTRGPDEALAEALRNLAAEPIDTELVELDGVTIIAVTGSFYAAEKLLDQVFMRALQDRLRADQLAAAAPTRGTLLVAAADDPHRLARFAAVVRHHHEHGGSRAISPVVLLVARGRVTGFVPASSVARADTASIRADTEPFGRK